MASIYKEIRIEAPAEDVWDAVRDFGALHERLVPGFVVAAELLGDVRTITFGNGSVVRERLVGIDDDARRLSYSVVDGAPSTTHHNASVQVFDAGNGRSRFVWITDVLPHELGSTIGGLMDQALVAIEKTLGANTPATQLT
jgi:carbon monoxide dehydrogenase subunit G